jgi:hypothetical protein
MKYSIYFILFTVFAVNSYADSCISFTKHTVSTDADGARAVFAIDLDDDEDIDLLSASRDDDKIAWYENDGSENFTEHEISTDADGAMEVFAIDVDGDGDIDILSASNNDDKIAWYENDGSENFTEHEISTDANGAYSVFAIDVDGDGDIDVLSASRNDDKIAWYENNGSEIFTEHEISMDARDAMEVFAIDIDQDGDIDILSASNNDNKIAWYENDGSENFTEHEISTDAYGARFVFALDVDGDGDIDVLSASFDDDKVAWYENDGGESFTAHTITTRADYVVSIFAIDVDGDGDIDVLSASLYDDKVAWYENDGSEIFTEHEISTDTDWAQSVYADDIDKDGDIDVISGSSNDNKIAWYEADHSGCVTAPFLLSPEDEATDQETSLNLNWNSVTDTSSYDVQLSDDDTFATTIVYDNVSDTIKAVSGLEYSTTYFWRVRAINISDTSSWSDIWSFETESNICSDEPTDTDGDGYRNISTLCQLRWVSENDSSWSWKFELDNDINAADTKNWNSGAGWSPIGNSDTAFTGNFNGHDYKIDSLFCDRSVTSGFFGYADSAKIERLYLSNCDISGSGTGSLVGKCYNTIINSCGATGKVSGGTRTGGLIGEIYWQSDEELSVVVKSYSKCEVSASHLCGGFVGFNSTGTISGCFATGDVRGDSSVHGQVGGFCGYSARGIENCYSRGDVTDSLYVGGFVGNLGEGLSLLNCYSTGKVTGISEVGGLIGRKRNNLTTNSCFWDTETSGIDSSAGGTGRTTFQMKQDTTFTNAGWDFDSTWAMCDTINAGYPNLEGINCEESSPTPSDTGWKNLTSYSPDGRVKHATAMILGTDKLVMFGGNTGSYSNETWVFDKSEGGWTKLNPTTSPGARYIHAMSYIGDDKVIIFGGIVSGSRNDETWVFDLSDENWTQLNPANPPSPRYYSAMSYLGGDKVVLFGGDDGGRDGETWIFDLSDETWTQKNPATAPGARMKHGMAYIGDDKTILFGGDDGGRDRETWIYDESDNTWTKTNPNSKPSGRYIHTMSYIGDDKALLFGGYDGGRDSETWIYDLSDENWTEKTTATSPSGRYYSSASYLGENCVVLFGGDDGGYDEETWSYDLIDNGWSQLNPGVKPRALSENSMAYITENEVVMFGGGDGIQYNETWMYNIDTKTWTQKSPNNKPSARDKHDMAYIGDDKVLLFGGNDGGYDDETWVYDKSDNNWTKLSPQNNPSGRENHSLSYIGDDKVMMFGGNTGSFNNQTWIFDLSDGNWVMKIPQNKPSARNSHAACYIGGDKVLLFGGDDGGNSNETWVYDLSEDSWTMLNPATKPSARSEHMLVRIGGDRALLFGGNEGVMDDETWVFDLGDEEWTKLTPSLKPSERQKSAIATLGNGIVFLHGGDEDPGYQLDYWCYTFQPRMPELIFPGNGATGVNLLVDLKWTKADYCNSFDIMVSENADMSSAIIDTNVTDSTFRLMGLFYNKTYYWKVRGILGSKTTDWTSVWSFTTKDEPLGIPMLVSPANGASGRELTLDLVWNEVNNAQNYNIQTSTDSTFSTVDFNSFTNDTTLNLSGLSNSTTYHWRVRAIGPNDTSGWSENWSFTTKSSGQLVDVPDSWNFIDKTGNNATIMVPENINPKIFNRNMAVGDAIGVFYRKNGAETCAGYEKWTGNNIGITVWGDNSQTSEKDGFDVNEGYIVKVWDAQSGVEYYGVATYSVGHDYYTVNGYSVMDTLAATATATHSITIEQGWNIISSFVDPEKALMDSVFKQIVSDIEIVKNTEGKSYIPTFGINDIGNWNLEEGYQVFANSAGILEVKGNKAIPENEDIALGSGWSIVAYLRDNLKDAAQAFATIVSDTSLLIAKNNAGKIYVPSFGLNTIGDLKPGQGYQLMLTKASTLTYPSNSAGRAATSNAYPVAKNLIPEHSKTGKDFTALVSVEAQNGSEVGIYNSNDVLIGSGVVMNGIAPVTVWGDNEKTQITDGALADEGLTLKVLEDGKLLGINVGTISSFISDESIQNLTFKKDEFLMIEAQSIENADIILNVSPNPVKDEFRMDLTLANEGIVSIRIFSLTGKLIKTITPKFYNSGTYIISENLEGIPAGEYNIVVEQNGRQAIEMIIKRK